MPTNYNGDPTGLAATDTVTISNPNDGEANSAASNASAPKKLADFMKFVLANAAFETTAKVFTALQTFNGGMKQSSTVSATYVLIATYGQVSGKLLRLYYDANGELSITINASWNGTAWVEDVTGLHQRFVFSQGTPGFHLQTIPSGTTTWAVGDWVAGVMSLFGLDQVSFSGTNPAASTGFSNKQMGANVCKAWGVLTCNGAGAVAVTEGFNVGTPTIGSNVITVPFATALSSGDYAVAGSQEIAGASTANLSIGFHTPVAASFKISIFDTGNARVNPATTSCRVHFQVFGKQ